MCKEDNTKSNQSMKVTKSRMGLKVIGALNLFALLILLNVSPGLGGTTSLQNLNLRMQRFIMRVVRDIGRHKSRKRRFIKSEQYGLVSLLLHRDDEKSTEEFLKEMMPDEKDMDVISLEELSGARGKNEDDPRLWLAVMGYVFDVSAGKKFYGVDGPYHVLTGRDATYALALGDLTIIDEKTRGRILSDSDRGEARRWLEYFVGHDKYVQVGRLPNQDDSIVDLDALLEAELVERFGDEGGSILAESEGGDNETEGNVPKWHPKVPSEMTEGDCMATGGK